MQFTHLGRSGLSVSRLCLGTMNFGPQTEESDAHSIMDSALDSGINFFDTANVYGGTDRRGWTEEIVGRWFASGGERRERVVLATKLYGTMTDRPNESKLSALNIRRALDASLRRLQTDYIDLYQFHHVDRDTPWDEIWQAIDVAVQQGKILYSGSSNFAGWHIAQAQAAAARRHYTGLVSEQSIYNLLVRAIELEVIPAAQSVRRGHHPVVTAAGRAARRGAEEGERRRSAARGSRAGVAGSASGPDPAVRGPGRRARTPTGRRRPRLAAGANRPSPRRSSGRGPRSSSTRPCGRWTSNWTSRPSPGWTRSSPVTRPPPRTTPGDRLCRTGRGRRRVPYGR